MYKCQLQELAQRSCFNLPSYSCIREGPDHAPRFKACVNFNGEMFESPNYCTTLRQAEHSAAEVALNALSTRGPSRSLTARVLDETGIYKNLLQATAYRARLKLPVYTTVRSGPGHVPTFTCSVELAGMNFTGEAAKTKKQAEKNAAIAAWSALKRNLGSISPMTNNKGESSVDQEQQEEQAAVTRLLSKFGQSNKEEHSRNLRRRSDDQTQTRRSRMVRGANDNHTPHGHSARDNNNVSSISSTDSLVQNLQDWRLIDDLLSDLVTPQVSSSSQTQKCFVSLLPPPPPRTESKILPPTATLNKLANSSCSSYSGSSYNSRPIPVQVRGNGKSQLAPWGDHQKDEEEWLGKKINEMEEGLHSHRPRASNNYLNSNSSKSGIYGSSGAYSSRNFPMSSNPIMAPAATTPSTTSDLMARRSWSNEGFVNPCSHRIAPAVQIRSVIPVCAAPPVAITPPSPIGPPIPRMKESITNSIASTSSTGSLSAAALKEFDSSPVDSSSSARSKFNVP